MTNCTPFLFELGQKVLLISESYGESYTIASRISTFKEENKYTLKEITGIFLEEQLCTFLKMEEDGYEQENNLKNAQPPISKSDAISDEELLLGTWVGSGDNCDAVITEKTCNFYDNGKIIKMYDIVVIGNNFHLAGCRKVQEDGTYKKKVDNEFRGTYIVSDKCLIMDFPTYSVSYRRGEIPSPKVPDPRPETNPDWVTPGCITPDSPGIYSTVTDIIPAPSPAMTKKLKLPSITSIMFLVSLISLFSWGTFKTTNEFNFKRHYTDNINEVKHGVYRAKAGWADERERKETKWAAGRAINWLIDRGITKGRTDTIIDGGPEADVKEWYDSVKIIVDDPSRVNSIPDPPSDIAIYPYNKEAFIWFFVSVFVCGISGIMFIIKKTIMTQEEPEAT